MGPLLALLVVEYPPRISLRLNYKNTILRHDEDMCEMAIGDSIVLSLERRPDAGTLLITSAVADALPDPADYALVLDLLDFSLGSAINGTPAIGRDVNNINAEEPNPNIIMV